MGLLGIRSLARVFFEIGLMTIEDVCAQLRGAKDERWDIRGRTVTVVTVEEDDDFIDEIYMEPADASFRVGTIRNEGRWADSRKVVIQ